MKSKNIIAKDGTKILIDEDDFEELSKFNWVVNNNGYTYSGKIGLMHRKILRAVKGQIVDHINRNKLDNRKSNLRFATNYQNWNLNCVIKKDWRYVSKYKGVTIYERKRKNNSLLSWQALIKYRRINLFIGEFKREKDAAKAYDRMAYFLFGEYAYLNFPENKEKYIVDINNGKLIKHVYKGWVNYINIAAYSGLHLYEHKDKLTYFDFKITIDHKFFNVLGKGARSGADKKFPPKPII